MSETMSLEDFAKAAIQEFGEKVVFEYIRISGEELAKFNENFKTTLTVEDFEKYKAVWLRDQNRCPKCDSELLGLFGSFDWGLVHGMGSCTNCNGISLRYYHYLVQGMKPLCAFSVEGF